MHFEGEWSEHQGREKSPALPGSASMPRKEEKKRKSSTSASRLSGRGLQGISVSGQRQLHVLCKREKSKNEMKMEKNQKKQD